MAADYEKQLRERLAQQQDRPRGFVRRHFVALSLGMVAVLAATAGIVAYQLERAATRERDIARYLTAARNGLSRDTFTAYQASLDALEQVLARDPGNPIASSLKGLALATLAVRYGDGDPWAAEKLIFGAGVGGDRDALLAGRWLLARSEGSEVALREVEEEILSDPPADAGATVLSLAGAVLLTRNEPAMAIERFNAAIQASPGHVPTLARVGDYYRQRGEHEEALRYYGLALAVAEDHPGALVGGAESQLETAREPAPLEDALALLGKLRSDRQVPVDSRPRLAMVRARLRAAIGSRGEALSELESLAEVEDPAVLLELAHTWVRIGAADVGLERFADFDPEASEDPAMREAYARLLVSAERYEEAASLRGRPGERGVHLQVGIARYRLRRFQAALSSLHATVLQKKLPVDAVVYLALVDLAHGRVDKARATLKRLGTGSRARTTGRWAYAELLLRVGDRPEAERVLREAVALDPLAVEPHCALGRLLLEGDDVEEALAELREAVRLDANHSDARRALGRTLRDTADPQGAITQWEAVLEQHPGDFAILAELVDLQLQQGEVERAVARAQAIARIFPKSGEAQRALGWATLAGGDAERAWNQFVSATRVAPRDPLAWAARGEAELAIGAVKGAETSFNKARTLRASLVDAQLGLARVEVARSKAIPAEKRLRPLIARLEKAGVSGDLARARAVLAQALLVQGKGGIAAARKEAEAAVELDDRGALPHLALAQALAASEERTLAASSFRRAADLAPGLAEIQLAQARNLLAGEGPSEEAAKALRRYLTLAPRGDGAAEARKLLSGLR